jgi:glycosidase
MKDISIGGVLIKDDNIIHDSTKEVFRYPLGAVRCGTEIMLALKPSGIDIESATLCVLHDGNVERYDMQDNRDGSLQDNGDGSFCPALGRTKRTVPIVLQAGGGEENGASGGDMLRVVYTAPAPSRGGGCLLWYWFEIRLPGGALCYYGSDSPYPSGLGRIYQNPPPAFQLTVYYEGFDTPDWAKNAIMYQIFPDRFAMGDRERVRAGIEYHSSKGRTEIMLHENWDGIPVYEARDGQEYYIPCDIFGGDLEGIRGKLPWLKSLGVNLLYINPIFEAASNHRYNAGDYLKIDPILGDDGDFQNLVKDAGEEGIRIVLDVAYSHTGDDSVYFNKYGRYDGVGAYQDTGSPYFGWYSFDSWPDRYKSWWGFETMPEVNEGNPDWQEFVISGQDSVVKHWLEKGASGYRLDVADELPDETIEQIRMAVKGQDPEALLLGEVWEDATTKQSYGKQRTYALGLGLDSVMNYPFLNRTIDFLRGRIDAWNYCRFLNHQRHIYPAPMYYALMNLTSSHDVCRMRSMLSRDFDTGAMSRAEQAVFKLTEEEYALGGRRQRLAAAIQFSLPGIPAVYYGDEVGMTGLLDPFNRMTWREEDASMLEWYKWLGNLRASRPVMSTGYVGFFATDGNVLGILRHSVLGCDFFGKETGSDAILTVVNPTDEPHRIVLDMGEVAGSLPIGRIGGAVLSGTQGAVSLLTGRRASLDKGLLVIDIPPLEAEIFGVI